MKTKLILIAVLAIASLGALVAQSPTPTPTPAPITPVAQPYLTATAIIPAATVQALLGGTMTLPQALSLPPGVTPSMLRGIMVQLLPNGSARMTLSYANPAAPTPTPAP